MRVIMGIQIEDRDSDAISVQELLTKHGCIIKTRLGLHEAAGTMCSSKGLLILEFISGSENEVSQLETELLKLKNVLVRKMEF
ncbi:hypothetical protein [Proteocatella sphenisci]|uniref:hypothetical protein n=1 Tax=Proteocatella sphenisci TaxID=181070 RepID=UPI00048E82CF|nr:hypothetical protein [Proteocatella sphenisci]